MGIQHKIIIPFAFLIIAAVAVTGLISAKLAGQITTRDAREQEKIRNMNREMGRVKEILTRSVPKTDALLEQIEPLFDGRIVLADVANTPVCMTIPGEKLPLFAEFLKPPAGADRPAINRVSIERRDYFIVADSRTDRPGFVYLIFESERLGPPPRRPETIIIAIGFASLAMALAVGCLVARTITRRLKTLANLTTQIAAGRFDSTVPAGGRDEIATLADAFNRMQAGLKEYREKLLAVEKMAALGQVSAAVVHEIRNPLNSIGMNVQLMQKEGALDRTALEIIRSEVERLKVVVDDLLNFARGPLIEKTPASLNEICEGTLALMERQLGHLNIKTVRVFAGGLPQIRVDTNRLRQVIMNLVINAADAMPGGGEMVLSTSPAGDLVRCSVGDTGGGVAPEDRDRIFDPAFTTKKGGTGLGLAVCKRIIEEHGGEIGFETGPNGTTFWFELPLNRKNS